MSLDLSDVVAIDVHTHVHRSTRTAETEPDLGAFYDYFGADTKPPTVPDLARYYSERQMMCVAFMVDNSWATGVPPAVSNAEIAELAADHAGVVIPFASVDPHSGAAGAREVTRLVAARGVKGFKFHPNTQAFFPNDRAVYPIYEAIAATGLPCVFHTGHTGAGAGVPGGDGIRLKFSNPMHVDDVAVDFPAMPIILAHPSFPWQDEAISVALHKPQVHIDLSGWSPKYFPPVLIQYANTLLRDKMLFGSDFPVITPDRWLADFEKLPIKDEVRPLILKANAARLLRL
jgi:predicted TIM-barrel fold metal-dependent hydrolase